MLETKEYISDTTQLLFKYIFFIYSSKPIIFFHIVILIPPNRSKSVIESTYQKSV